VYLQLSLYLRAKKRIQRSARHSHTLLKVPPSVLTLADQFQVSLRSPTTDLADNTPKSSSFKLPFLSRKLFKAHRQLRELRLAISVRRQKKNSLVEPRDSAAILDGPAGLASDMATGSRRRGGDISAIFVHAGAGYHSHQNQGNHLQACNE